MDVCFFSSIVSLIAERKPKSKSQVTSKRLNGSSFIERHQNVRDASSERNRLPAASGQERVFFFFKAGVGGIFCTHMNRNEGFWKTSGAPVPQLGQREPFSVTTSNVP